MIKDVSHLSPPDSRPPRTYGLRVQKLWSDIVGNRFDDFHQPELPDANFGTASKYRISQHSRAVRAADNSAGYSVHVGNQ